MRFPGNLGLQASQASDQVDGSATVTPFVVVPAYYLDKFTFVTQHVCVVSSEDGTVWIPNDIGRNNRIFTVGEDTLQGALRRRFHGRINIACSHR